MITNELTKTLERQKGIPAAYTFVTGHRMRAIDLLYRIFCTPFADNVVAPEPACDDYRQLADVNHIAYLEAPLDSEFRLTADALLKACNAKTRLVWLSLPSSVTGNNNMVRAEVEQLLGRFTGIVVADETFSDYARLRSLRFELPKYPRLIVLDAPGLLFAQPTVVERLAKLAYLYDYEGDLLSALPDPFDLERRVRLCVQERTRLMEAFRELPLCEHVFASESDFFLVRMRDADTIVAYLAQRGISISRLPQHNVLIIPIGTRSENNELVGALRQMGREPRC